MHREAESGVTGCAHPRPVRIAYKSLCERPDTKQARLYERLDWPQPGSHRGCKHQGRLGLRVCGRCKPGVSQCPRCSRTAHRMRTAHPLITK